MASAPAASLAAGAEAQPQWAILACLDTRCGLSHPADEYQRRLAGVCRERRWPLAALRIAETGDGMAERLLLLEKSGWRQRRTGVVADVPRSIGRAAAEFFASRPARYVLLVIVGHGAGLLEADEARGMDAARLGEALRGVAQERGRPLDLLGLDTCFGGALEKLWELQGAADYVTAAPGVVYSPGLRWDEALAEAGSGGPRALAEEVAKLGMAGGTLDAALVSIDISGLAGVGEPLAALSEELVATLAARGQAVTYARSRARNWGRRSELCDLGALATQLQAAGGEGELAARAGRLREALEGDIIARWWGEGAPGDGSSGVGVYFPGTFEAVPASYRNLDLAERSGWYRFLSSYWAWVASLVGVQAHPPH